MSPSPYAGTRIALATSHAKEIALSPAFREVLGADLVVPPGLDTDRLGTFTGEIERVGKMGEVALAKARLGMAAAGLKLGLASEGTFGPDRVTGFLAEAVELLTFVDDERGLVASEVLTTLETNFAHAVLTAGDDPGPFLDRIGFPSHGVIVRPEAIQDFITKGLTERRDVDAAVTVAQGRSPVGRAVIETDMRAHMNPTRMASLAQLGERLARRLAVPCPACAAPGYGRIGSETGLACADCGTPTGLVAREIFGCTACGHRDSRRRSDGLTSADPGHCPVCNP